MEKLLETLWQTVKSPLAKCLVTILGVFLGGQEVVTRLSDSGFSPEITEHRRPILLFLSVFSLFIGSIVYARSSGRRLRQRIADLEEELRICRATLEVETRRGDELAQAKTLIPTLLADRPESDAFELLRASYESNVLYIEVQKRRGRKLLIGSILIVMHKEDKKLMGHFRVIEERSKSYYAQGVSAIDNLWAGQVKEKGELSMFPRMTAIHVREVQSDDE